LKNEDLLGGGTLGLPVSSNTQYIIAILGDSSPKYDSFTYYRIEDSSDRVFGIPISAIHYCYFSKLLEGFSALRIVI
jgi:hypothetical protein